MSNKLQTIVDGLRQFAATKNNLFTAKEVADHFSVHIDTARKALRQIDGLQPDRGTWSFISKAGRVIKTSPAARNHKILRYFRSACYNAAKLGLSQEEMKHRLAGWLDEYEIHSSRSLKVAA